MKINGRTSVTLSLDAFEWHIFLYFSSEIDRIKVEGDERDSRLNVRDFSERTAREKNAGKSTDSTQSDTSFLSLQISSCGMWVTMWGSLYFIHLYIRCKMLNIVFRGTLCTTEPHGGGRGDAKERGREKKDVIRCEKRRGEGAAREVRVKRERERETVGGGGGGEGWSQSWQGSVTFSCEDKLFWKINKEAKKNKKKRRQGDTAAPTAEIFELYSWKHTCAGSMASHSCLLIGLLVRPPRIEPNQGFS